MKILAVIAATAALALSGYTVHRVNILEDHNDAVNERLASLEDRIDAVENGQRIIVDELRRSRQIAEAGVAAGMSAVAEAQRNREAMERMFHEHQEK